MRQTNFVYYLAPLLFMRLLLRGGAGEGGGGGLYQLDTATMTELARQLTDPHDRKVP